MRKNFSFLILVIFCSMLSASDKKTLTVQLPKNSNVVVINKRRIRDPLGQQKCSIFVDGTIQASLGIVFGGEEASPPVFESKITQQELKELLQIILVDEKLLKMNDAYHKQKKLKTKKNKAPDTLLTILINGKRHKIECYGLSDYAKQKHGIKKLKHLETVVMRLHHLENIARVGGKAELKKLVKKLNVELKKKHPKERPFTIQSLEMVMAGKWGSRIVFFKRSYKGKGKKTKTFLSGRIDIPEEGEEKYRISQEEE